MAVQCCPRRSCLRADGRARRRRGSTTGRVRRYPPVRGRSGDRLNRPTLSEQFWRLSWGVTLAGRRATPSGGSPLLLSHRRHSGGNLGGFWIRRRAAATARVPPRRLSGSQGGAGWHSAPTRLLATDRLAGGPTRARFPRREGGALAWCETLVLKQTRSRPTSRRLADAWVGYSRRLGTERGSPKWGSTPLSAKNVISAILLPARVSTSSP